MGSISAPCGVDVGDVESMAEGDKAGEVATTVRCGCN